MTSIFCFNSTFHSSSSAFCFNVYNGTIVNESDTIAWTLASGDNNANTICCNVTDGDKYTIITDWDEFADVSYSSNDTNATSGISDFVWVQIELNMPRSVDYAGEHASIIYITMKQAKNSISNY